MKQPYLLVALALAVLLGGCASDDMADLRNYVEDVKAREPGPIEPIPAFKQIETYAYRSTGLRNPFQASFGQEVASDVPSGTGIQPDFTRRKEELESFPLDTLRMVGTMQQEDELWGLVQTDDGTIYRVQPGNYMGQNHGRITRVFDEKIELTELIQDGQGGYIERVASLGLGEE